MNHSLFQKTIHLFCAIHQRSNIFSSLFIDGNTVIDIQNSRDFSYAELKCRDLRQQQAWQAGYVSVHDIVTSYAVRYDKTLIDWIL